MRPNEAKQLFWLKSPKTSLLGQKPVFLAKLTKTTFLGQIRRKQAFSAKIDQFGNRILGSDGNIHDLHAQAGGSI